VLFESRPILVLLKNIKGIDVLGVLKKVESEGGLFFMSLGDADIFLNEGNECLSLAGRTSTRNKMLSIRPLPPGSEAIGSLSEKTFLTVHRFRKKWQITLRFLLILPGLSFYRKPIILSVPAIPSHRRASGSLKQNFDLKRISRNYHFIKHSFMAGILFMWYSMTSRPPTRICPLWTVFQFGRN